VAVADAVEVMSARQLYRSPLTPDEIIAELRRCSGAQWDARVVDIVLDLIGEERLQWGTDGLRLLDVAPARPETTDVAVLLVEDDDELALRVTEALERAIDGAVVSRASSLAGAAELMTSSSWSLAIVDHHVPGGPGMQILDSLHAHDPSMPIVLLTGLGSEATAIEAFRHGASDYVVKGGSYLDALALRVRGLVAA
jgi:response regulator RpfG family c-di-GMP phosphodiesterase